MVAASAALAFGAERLGHAARELERLARQGEVQEARIRTREYDLAKKAAGQEIGGRVFLCTYSALVTAGNAVYHDGQRIHAVVELSLDMTSPGVFRIFKMNQVALFNGPIAAVLSNKKSLVLLSQHAKSPVFSSIEQELLLRHVPWSRCVTPGPTEIHGEMAEMADILASRRENLVLKQAGSYGGKDVFVGRFTSASDWEEQARLALVKSDWIVQEHVESLPYLFQCGQGCAPHAVIWGPFYFGDTYGGVILRMQPSAEKGPVNLSRTATEGIVLEVAE